MAPALLGALLLALSALSPARAATRAGAAQARAPEARVSAGSPRSNSLL